ncbi:thiamine pyrophosphate-binding protein [Microbacterium sp. B2969]|uniref:Thiamine pyrophosphate-binding protein n=1 Tax=Microbacterium alkaliflavum TaxID=3248839 RepID=A0ABW7Q717_9MICO
MRVSVAEAVGRTLAHLGVAHAFGVVGSGNFHVTNALIAAGVPFVATRHEMGATCMADAFTRVTGRVSAVSVHQGCGLTNAMTGIGEAAKSGTPIIVVSGDTPAYEKTSNFYIDQDAAVAALGASPHRIHRASTAVADTCRAFADAVTQRRTVVLSLPLDLQAAEIDWDPADVRLPATIRSGDASPDAVRELAELLRRAERPVIVAGRGARGAAAELRALAATTGALLATSAVARGLFADDPWSVDVMGGFSTDPVADLIADADLVVAFGAVLTRWTTRNGALARAKTLVQVDDRAAAIGSHQAVDLGVIGDAAEVACAVEALLARDGGSPSGGYRTAEVRTRIDQTRRWRDIPYEDEGDDAHIDPRTLTIALDDLIPSERVLTVDGGNFCGYPAMFLRVPDERGFVLPLAFQSIGLSLASGIGAGVASPGRVPVVGLGDGSFMMSHVELDTAVRLGLGIVVVVYNDDAYGAEAQHFTTEDLRTVVFPDTDIAAIARGYGCDAVTVRSLDDIEPVRAWLAGPRTRPLVIDAKIAAFPSWMNAHAMSKH